MGYRYTLLILLFSVTSAFADSKTLWSDVNASEQAKLTNVTKATPLSLMPDSYRLYRLDKEAMRNRLELANKSIVSQKSESTTALELPLPSGEFLNLNVIESSVMAPELAAQYPEIKTYRVDANDNKGIYGVVDITQQSFHAMLFMTDGSRLFVDPRESGDETVYVSYYSKHYHPAEKQPFKCDIDSHEPSDNLTVKDHSKSYSEKYKTAQRSGTNLRTYRLAMAATGEYTAFHGGTVAGALSAMNTTVSRVNVIYERDLAVKLELIANNNLIIFTDANTDPYSNGDGGAMLNQNKTEVDATIGSANYDIGHVVSTGGGGVAQLSAVCGSGKARGVTGSSQPVNDSFDIDFVAHEIGHQFGGTHTFNSTSGSCAGGNRTGSTAFEPGSGTTIQAYAGICGSANNTQNNSDAMFHIGSIAQMSDFINGGGSSCGTETSLSNQQPVSNAGSDYAIPANTPFELTGVATDADADTLTYSWEQVDTGTASDINVVESDNAIFRTFLPKSTTTRVFPKLSSIISNTVSKGETLPTIARDINMSFAVRDQKGGVAADEMKITVASSTGFKITSHNASATLGANSTTQVTWDVANTAATPVSCSAVDVLFSTDEGSTFIAIASDTNNDGSEVVTIPANAAATATARFKIKCTDNIFFDISDANLTVQNSGVSILSAVFSNIGSNNVADPGETVHLTVPIQSYETAVTTNVSGVLSSSDAGTNIVVANSAYPSIPPASQVNNSTLYQVQIPADHTCGVAIPLTLNASYTLGSTSNISSNFTLPVGSDSAASTSNSTSQAIPDSTSEGITSTITLAGLGMISQPKITIDVDITHTFRGDLILDLTSPQGTTVRLKNTNNSDGTDNLVGNYPNTLTSVENLSAFDGENLDGNWVLKVSDNFGADTGTLNSWTLNYSQAVCEIVTNTAPVASNSNLSTNEGVSVSGTLQATDADGNGLTYNLVSNGTKGTAVITNTSTGAFTYTPANNQTGNDTFTFNVSDGSATSNTATVIITINAVETPTFNWDVDGDGAVKPLTDGLLVLRHQFGFTGSTLISGAVDTNATRTTASEIETYLATGQAASDIDGDGSNKPLTDGLLLLRYLFGFRGDTLIQGAVDGGGSRQTATEIESYINGLLPQ